MNKIQSEINPYQIIESIDNSLSAIDKFDLEILDSKEREEILKKLTNIEALALELKAKFTD